MQLGSTPAARLASLVLLGTLTVMLAGCGGRDDGAIVVVIPYEDVSVWDMSASPKQFKPDKAYRWDCTVEELDGAVAAPEVYGTDIYADYSLVCWAAVHAGLITTVSGGTVTLVLGEPQEFYVGTLRNGIQSLDDEGVAPRSFTFVGTTVEDLTPGGTVGCAYAGRGQASTSYTCDVPAGGAAEMHVAIAADQSAGFEWTGASNARFRTIVTHADGTAWDQPSVHNYSAGRLHGSDGDTFTLRWENVNAGAASLTVTYTGNYQVVG